MKPSVGRIVHYQAVEVSRDGDETRVVTRAAIITDVTPPSLIVGLCILAPQGLGFRRDVAFSEAPEAGRWNWPPRVEG